MPDAYQKVAILENQVEAQLLDTILAERDIPHMIRSYYDSAYDGIFQMQKGWGAVIARDTDKEEILEVLNDIRTQSAEAVDKSTGAPHGE